MLSSSNTVFFQALDTLLDIILFNSIVSTPAPLILGNLCWALLTPIGMSWYN